jgi:hypothetical protein
MLNGRGWKNEGNTRRASAWKHGERGSPERNAQELLAKGSILRDAPKFFAAT